MIQINRASFRNLFEWQMPEQFRKRLFRKLLPDFFPGPKQFFPGRKNTGVNRQYNSITKKSDCGFFFQRTYLHDLPVVVQFN
jgi:hypothetical protein